MRHSRPNLAEVLWTQATPQQAKAAGRLIHQQTGTFHFASTECVSHDSFIAYTFVLLAAWLWHHGVCLLQLCDVGVVHFDRPLAVLVLLSLVRQCCDPNSAPISGAVAKTGHC